MTFLSIQITNLLSISKVADYQLAPFSGLDMNSSVVCFNSRGCNILLRVYSTTMLSLTGKPISGLCVTSRKSSKIPQLPWKRILPPMWANAWTTFLEAVSKNKPPAVKDECVWHILPIFATGYNRLPFRLLTKEEVILVSGLTEHMSSLLSVSNYVSEATVRNICGNSFHPKLIGSALGSDQDLRTWIEAKVTYAQTSNIPSPREIISKFKEVRSELMSNFRKHKIGPVSALTTSVAGDVPFPEMLLSRPNDLLKDPPLAAIEAKVQPPEFFPVPIRVDKKEPSNTQLCSSCFDFLQQHSYDNVLAMIDLVGLPPIDPSAIVDFFFYQQDKIHHVAHLKAVREEITNGLWRVGRVGNLFTTISFRTAKAN